MNIDLQVEHILKHKYSIDDKNHVGDAAARDAAQNCKALIKPVHTQMNISCTQSNMATLCYGAAYWWMHLKSESAGESQPCQQAREE